MTIAKVEVERFSLTSSKPFDAVVAALKSAVGQPNMAEFFKETRDVFFGQTGMNSSNKEVGARIAGIFIVFLAGSLAVERVC